MLVASSRLFGSSFLPPHRIGWAIRSLTLSEVGSIDASRPHASFEGRFWAFLREVRTAQYLPPGFCAARRYRQRLNSARSAGGRRCLPLIGVNRFKLPKND